MFRLIKDLFILLTDDQRKRFYQLQFLVTIMAFTEVAGVASIAPFMALVGDMEMLNRDNFIAQIYQQSGFSSANDFVFALGVVVILMLTLAATLSMYTTWRQSLFANKVGVEVADRLYSYYLHQDWLFHVRSSSSQLTKQISNEST